MTSNFKIWFRIFLILLMTGPSLVGEAREYCVKGVCMDSIGGALAYTDILIKGSNLKIMSDVEGRFYLELKGRKRLTFLWCNYKPVRMWVRKDKKMEVVMSIRKSEIHIIDK